MSDTTKILDKAFKKIKDASFGKEMTALVRNSSGNLKVIHDDYFKTQSDFANELRSNGFRVLKIWSKNIPNDVAYNWEFMNRKK